MPLIPIERDPQPRQLWVFSLLWLLFLGALGAGLLHRGTPWGWVLGIWSTAALMPLATLLYRPLARWLFVAVSVATWPIGWVLSHVLLATVYYLLLTPLGLVLRLTGRDPLQRRREPEPGSYWRRREPTKHPDRYFRQF
ncbi:MAG: SxtJ family membrane protein [Acidobacteriota bacterium]|nr:SxtJ family membrane protein [Acidobacteriota bacterium]